MAVLGRTHCTGIYFCVAAVIKIDCASENHLCTIVIPYWLIIITSMKNEVIQLN
jgi:hypothetical protein